MGQSCRTDDEKNSVKADTQFYVPRVYCHEERSKAKEIFFVIDVYLETMMERLNSGEQKIIFRNISCFVITGLMASGRASWQREEETRKYISIVLIRQEQSCTSELFKVIQDVLSLILHYRTMS